MEDIKAICNEITEQIDVIANDDISLPTQQKDLVQSALNDALYIIQAYHKTKKHNMMVELIFELVRKVEEYKANIPYHLEIDELDSNIQELETITDLFDQLI